MSLIGDENASKMGTGRIRVAILEEGGGGVIDGKVKKLCESLCTQL